MMQYLDQLSPFLTPEYVTLRQAVLWIGLKLVPAPPHVEAYRNDPKTVESQGLLSNHDYSKIERAKSLLYDRLSNGSMGSRGTRKDVYDYYANQVGNMVNYEESIDKGEWAFSYVRWDASALLFSDYDDVSYIENAYLNIIIKTNELVYVFPPEQIVPTVVCDSADVSGTYEPHKNGGGDIVMEASKLENHEFLSSTTKIYLVKRPSGNEGLAWDWLDRHYSEYNFSLRGHATVMDKRMSSELNLGYHKIACSYRNRWMHAHGVKRGIM